jgi:Fuc2NAc and GlcNAc transferase
MNDMALFLLLIAGLGVISFALTFFIMKTGKMKLLAIPNARSLHEVPTPKGGGIAIVLTWYLGISVLYFAGEIEKNLYYAMLSGLMIAIVSFIDDLFELKPWIRLIVHFITAITAFYFLGCLRPLVFPALHFNYNFIVYPVAIIGMVWFINLFNFMDGVDGFASLEAITICSVLFVISGGLINVVLIICVAGFLFWNWPKADEFWTDYFIKNRKSRKPVKI